MAYLRGDVYSFEKRPESIERRIVIRVFKKEHASEVIAHLEVVGVKHKDTADPFPSGPGPR